MSTTDKFTEAHNALNMVDMLLVEAGYKQDSAIRHNLAIAKSMFRDAERGVTDMIERAPLKDGEFFPRPHRHPGPVPGCPECIREAR